MLSVWHFASLVVTRITHYARSRSFNSLILSVLLHSHHFPKSSGLCSLAVSAVAICDLIPPTEMVFSTLSLSPPLSLRYLPRSRPGASKFPVRCSASVSPTTQSKSAIFDLKTYWTTLIGEINQKLEEAITVQYPQQIYEAMRHSVLAEGAKRAPPVMCVAACELLGGSRLAAFPTACALEMV